MANTQRNGRPGGLNSDTALARAKGLGLAGSCQGLAARKHPQCVTGQASLGRGAKSARRHLPGERTTLAAGAGGWYWTSLVLTLAFAWAVTL